MKKQKNKQTEIVANSPAKSRPTMRVRCTESRKGRIVKHPRTLVPIKVGDIVDLPELLAKALVDRGDYEAAPEEKAPEPEKVKEEANVDP